MIPEPTTLISLDPEPRKVSILPSYRNDRRDRVRISVDYFSKPITVHAADLIAAINKARGAHDPN
jgi:hypothetical protein